MPKRSPSSIGMKTAIVTGACSGMGLALTRDLLSKSDWSVVLADINVSAYDSISSSFESDRHIFVHTNVSNWLENVALFKKAYSWSGGRIDFFAANAGISDKEDMLHSPDLNEDEPVKPNLSCVEVDLFAIFYGLKLFIYFTRKTRLGLATATGCAVFDPKMVITASMAGQYPFFISPQYSAAKHGCVGLVRTAAPALLKHENIALNCIMPGFVDTNILPPGLAASWPREHITPLSTIVRAFNELTDDHGRVKPDGKSDGTDRLVKSGCTVECSGDELFYRESVDYANASQKWVTDQSREDGILGLMKSEMIAEGRHI